MAVERATGRITAPLLGPTSSANAWPLETHVLLAAAASSRPGIAEPAESAAPDAVTAIRSATVADPPDTDAPDADT